MPLWGPYVSQANVAQVLREAYGTGVDGDVTIAGTITLSQHRAYRNLVVPAGQILQPEGWFAAAQRKITIGGTVRRNGITATTGSAASAITINAFGGPWTGAAAGGAAAGTGTSNATNKPAFGGRGGAGGAGSGGAGGSSGTISNGTFTGAPDADPWCLLAMRLATWVEANGAWGTGAGGAGGGGNGVQTGGGGGSCAGGIILVAPIIEILSGGLVQAIGGDGAPGQAANCGGGGGGGGGTIVLLCEQLIEYGTVSVAGGIGGASGGGAGVQGSDGSAGKIYRTGVL